MKKSPSRKRLRTPVNLLRQDQRPVRRLWKELMVDEPPMDAQLESGVIPDELKGLLQGFFNRRVGETFQGIFHFQQWEQKLSQPIVELVSALIFEDPQLIRWKNPYLRLLAKFFVFKALEIRSQFQKKTTLKKSKI